MSWLRRSQRLDGRRRSAKLAREAAIDLRKKFRQQALGQRLAAVDAQKLVPLDVDVVRHERVDGYYQFLAPAAAAEGQHSLLAVHNPGGLPVARAWERYRERAGDSAGVSRAVSTIGTESRFRRERQDDRIWKEHLVAIEIVGDIADVALRLRSLVTGERAAAFARRVPDARQREQVAARECEHVERMLRVLLDSEGVPFDYPSARHVTSRHHRIGGKSASAHTDGQRFGSRGAGWFERSLGTSEERSR